MMILILPFMQMKSGHHQVADALEAHIYQQNPHVSVEKIDIFHYTLPRLERIVSKCYLTWIQQYPNSYSRFYKKNFNANDYQVRLFQPFEYMMQQALEKIILEKQPEAIICTHSFPSHAASRLKQAGKTQVPIINAYTDFFTSGVWAKDGVDLHLAPSTHVAKHLMEQFHVAEEKIVISGIPIHPEIRPVTKRKVKHPLHILIAGGNSGLGNIKSLVNQCCGLRNTQFSVLCGNNRKLLQELQNLSLPNVTPLSYIESREQMNALYDQVDAIISKPGGVTVAEALSKKIPTFIESELPGQEQINMDYLVPAQLVFQTTDCDHSLLEVYSILNNETEMKKFERAIQMYEQDFDLHLAELIHKILGNLPHAKQPYHCEPFNRLALLS
ncbi:hypothetical protein CSE16_20055 [Solibacillus sp. R5-41]|uniref:MGDG synthase family glycosyltransferase n=1 Tax=Solibacillus sp. R5-41 TaxID=2048654 RepID=UPI000C125DD9|nr:glycosyltransferase [Solibacillus sp. R5-41]ATP42120.1 hypothetical protein CSE16_20055 [Solibacillus sp. R5-41]